MNVLDLFSGIGGFSLGLERAGMRTLAFCEIAPYCRRVISRHWPGVPIFDDVRFLSAAGLVSRGVTGIDVVCGGFPCQDISLAGSGRGIEGARSGLWVEFARVVGEVRPRFALVENVGAILGRGLDRVLGDFAALGYGVLWNSIPASAVGAHHLRDRIWIVAVDHSDADGAGLRGVRVKESPGERGETGDLADGLGALRRWNGPADPDAAGERLEKLLRLQQRIAQEIAATEASREWTTESPLRRMADDVPARLDRPRTEALGNAVVPVIPELLGRAIMKWQAEQ